MARLKNISSEDYLKAIYLLGQSKPSGRILTKEIADKLRIRPASVTGMLNRLAEAGFVDYRKRQGVYLTDAGEKIALTMIRRHRLIETFLYEKLGYTWEEVHEEAERLEHAVTAAFCERLEEILGFPQTDPHGDPIPTAALERPPVNNTPLSACLVGDRGVIDRVADGDPDLLQKADFYGLRPGTNFELVAGPPLTLYLPKINITQTIDPAIGTKIYVKLL
ncbi:MAG: metal-dependent transcriptional regulator [Ardenticatenaceae bacterium]|nr:metal-dependent transcriptional regulator [Ardenticatenaceae bacterium]